MCDVSDPQIKQAYDEVVASAEPGGTDWCLIKYTGRNQLGFAGKGSGGADEMCQHIDDESEAYFGFVKVCFTSGDGTARTKWVLVTYIGSDVKVMQKAKVSVHKASVKEVFSDFTIEVQPDQGKKDQLSQDCLIERLLSVNF
eukprot:CAMPEP_0174251620 /NCGR_PEP_ID=MMETSP0439-20130205/1373_1 /TAXON_ID=0 /ORGANISM="Stereomyxa ramosa, Strain Chinc5" /LENGTH=141 /DNA_ID=CAMNT_0015331971 /DNA_START=89 /DNA_END=514 /DNA_ORIENTATION=+